MKMTALVRQGSGLRVDRARPMPVQANGDVLIRVRAAAVFPEDLAAEEGAGVAGASVVGIAEGADGRGRRVTSETRTWCGRCDRCRGGLRQYCPDGGRLGMGGRPGTFAEWCALPEDLLVPVPERLDDDAVLCAPLVALGLGVQQLIGAARPAFVTVLGDGARALILVQVLSRMNPRVRLLSRDPENLARCERWGVRHRSIDEAGRRGDQEIVVDAGAAENGPALAAGFVRPRGMLILVGRSGRPTLLPSEVASADVTVRFGSPVSVREGLEAIIRMGLDVTSVIGSRLTPEQMAAGALGDGGLLNIVDFASVREGG